MYTYLKMLNEAEEKAISLDKDGENVKWLLLELSGLSSSEFYLNLHSEVPNALIKKFNRGLNKYLYKNIPVQHIVGYSYFYGEKFIVNKNVLIPRNETEQLVEHALIFSDLYFEDYKEIKILDLATGSGCIANTLANEINNSKVVATDISRKALKVAQKNAYNLNVDVEFIKSNWFDKVSGKFDLIIANPPYLFLDELIGDTVDKEPKIALYGGSNGLIHYETIIKNIEPYLEDKAIVGFEHGIYHQSELVDLIKTYFPDALIKTFNDFNDLPRHTFFAVGGLLNYE